MSTIEKINKELDKLPDDRLNDVLKYLYKLRNNTTSNRKNRRIHLKSQNFENGSKDDSSYVVPDELTDFQKFLLAAPVMTEDDYAFFLEKKENFNKWK